MKLPYHVTSQQESFFKSIESNPSQFPVCGDFLVQWDTGLGQIMLGKYNVAQNKFFTLDDSSCIPPKNCVKLADYRLADIFIKEGKWIFDK